MPRWGARRVDVASLDVEDSDFHEPLEHAVMESHSPPRRLRDMSWEAPETGYASHKGCLFPSKGSAVKSRFSRWNRQGELGSVGHELPSIEVAEPLEQTTPAVTFAKAATSTVAASMGSAVQSRKRNERRTRARGVKRDSQEEEDTKRRAVVWLRDDLRLDDNPALREAAEFASVVCIYIHDTEDPSPWPLRGAARWWKSESLRVFAQTLRSIGSELYFQVGTPSDVLCSVCLEVGADVVMWNRLCEPWYHDRDEHIKSCCELNGLEVRTFKAAVLWEPWEARPDERSYNRGFGSVGFYRSAVEELGEVPEPLLPVSRLPGVPTESRAALAANCVAWEDLGYHFTAGRGFPRDMRNHNEQRQKRVPEDDWATLMKRSWVVGEQGAQRRLREFLQQVLSEGIYEGRGRFLATEKWTAILSPYIRFGELSPRRCYHEALHLTRKVSTDKGPRPVNNTFMRRFFWRDLAYWCLWRFPEMPTVSLRSHYETERWSGSDLQLRQWQQGRTGFPLVDAGMRQLWRLGWMPNYLRHVCAQFLIEFLDMSWKKGFEWFDYTLLDADVAINAFMWQNGGHSGLDQWNFVMHPVFAAKSCDPTGEYVRRWLPELSHLPAEYIHCPWEAPNRLLLGANVLVNLTYSDRIVADLDKARREHTREVLRVRNAHHEIIAKGGNEWFEARPGYWVTLITRDDFRQNTEEFLTKQTADDPRHQQRRQLQDPLSIVMGDFTRHFKDV